MKRTLIIISALLFVMAFTGLALAQEKNYSLNNDFKGQVTAVDVLTKTLTARSNDPLMGTSVFTLDDLTRVTMCGQLKTIEDVNAGDKVTVTYHEGNGELYADAIDLPAPMVACLLPME